MVAYATLAGPAKQRVLEALKKHGSRKGYGPNYQCPVPGHEDTNPSLSVNEENGKVLLHCHAGCSTVAICAALGLKPEQLFDDCGTQHQTLTPKAVYQYQDANGKPLRIFERHHGNPRDYYLWKHPDGSKCNGDGNPHVPYRLPEVIEGLKQGKVLYVVEGEKDVETLRKHGLLATTAPGGKWGLAETKVLAPYLSGSQVIVIADRDSTGIQKARGAKIALDVHAKLVKLKHSPLEKPGSDVTDHLAAGYQLEDLVDELPNLQDGKEPVKKKSGLTCFDLSDLSNLQAEPPPMLIDGLLAEQATLLVAGPSNGGKTTAMRDLEAALAEGSNWMGFEVSKPRRVMWIDLEQGVVFAKWRLHGTLVGRNTLLDARERISYVHGHTNMTDNDGRQEVEALIRKYRPELVIIDSQIKATAGLVENSNEEFAKQNLWFQKLRNEFRLTLGILHHSGKAGMGYVSRGKRLDKARGASEIVANADQVWYIQKTKDGNAVELSVEKDRYTLKGELPRFVIGMNAEDPVKGPFRLYCAGEPKGAPSEGALIVQLQYLMDNGGTAKTAELNEAAKAANVGSNRTISRARNHGDRIGLIKKKGHGHWSITAEGREKVSERSLAPF